MLILSGEHVQELGNGVLLVVVDVVGGLVHLQDEITSDNR